MSSTTEAREPQGDQEQEQVQHITTTAPSDTELAEHEHLLPPSSFFSEHPLKPALDADAEDHQRIELVSTRSSQSPRQPFNPTYQRRYAHDEASAYSGDYSDNARHKQKRPERLPTTTYQPPQVDDGESGYSGDQNDTPRHGLRWVDEPGESISRPRSPFVDVKIDANNSEDREKNKYWKLSDTSENEPWWSYVPADSHSKGKEKEKAPQTDIAASRVEGFLEPGAGLVVTPPMLEKHGRRHLDKISSMYRAIHNGECENPFFASSKEQISTMWEEYSYLASFDRRINNKDGIDSLNSSERLANRPKATYRNDIVYRQPKSPTAYMQPRTATNSANNWNFDYISPPDEEALARDGFVPEWQRTERFQRDLAANTDETPPKAQIDDENGPKYIVKVDLSPHLMDRDLNSDGPLSHLWTQRKAHMENGARTEMLTISSIEHYYNDAGESSTSITNLDAPNGISDYHLSPKFRWLNIQQGTLSLRLLKDLVCNCPYIDEETLSVTVRLLRDQEEKMKIPSDNNGPDEPGTAIRYDGILKGRRWTATSVTFLTAPFMTIKHGNFNHKRRTDEYSARNMLQMLYQYDPEDKIIGFSGSTTYDALFGKKAAVYVPEMWCLLIDPNIIITMSELSLAELRGRNIHIESFEPYNSSCTVLFHCDNGITERRGITRDWTFTRLLRLADEVKGQISQTDEAHGTLMLEDPSGTILTEDAWKKLIDYNDSREINLRISSHRFSEQPSWDLRTPSFSPWSLHAAVRDPPHRRPPFPSTIDIEPALNGLKIIKDDLSKPRDTVSDSELILSVKKQDHISPPRGALSECSMSECSMDDIPIEPSVSNKVELWLAGIKDERHDSVSPKSNMGTERTLGPWYSGPGYLIPEAVTNMTDLRHAMRPIDRSRAHSSNNRGIRSPRRTGTEPRYNDGAASIVTGASTTRHTDWYSTARSEAAYVLDSSSDDASDDASTNEDKGVRGEQAILGIQQRTYTIGPHRSNSRSYSSKDSSSISLETPSQAPLKSEHGVHVDIRHSGEIKKLPEPPWQISRSHTQELQLNSQAQSHKEHIGPTKSFPSQDTNFKRRLQASSLPDFNPMFTWVRTKNAAAPKDALNPRNVFRILTRIHKSLSTQDKIYNSMYECTLNELLTRHPRTSHNSPNSEDPITREAPIKPRPPEADGQDTSPKEASRSDTDFKDTKKRVRFRNLSVSGIGITNKPKSPRLKASNGFNHNSGRMAMESFVESSLALLSRFAIRHPIGSLQKIPTVQGYLRDMETQIEDLCFVSNRFIHLFLPQSIFDHNTVVQKFWGSVEKIARQAELSFTLAAPGQTEAWSIRTPSFSGPLQADSLAQHLSTDCQRCKRADKYQSLLEALKHLHTHTGEHKHDSTYEPHEDPCIVWLQAHHGLRYERWSNQIRPMVKFLIATVAELQRKAIEFGERCTRPIANGKAGTDLPRNMVFAFEAIIGLYCNVADSITHINSMWMNEDCELDHSLATSGSEEADAWRKNFTKYEKRANTLLEEAHKDAILLENLDAKPERIHIEPVGREFLLGAILSNLHNRPLEENSNMDAIGAFKKHASRLQYLVHSRPKKRLFIELTTLETELEALRKVLEYQVTMLKKFSEITNPRSYNIVRRDSYAQYELVLECIDNLQHKLLAEGVQIQGLQQKVAHLKTQVLQILEVLEEGHGKAIRVFTLVTLFFLPMSFITSFMGMNTADIRDMDNNSALFWLTALPFTAAVVGLAFIYGYKWDEILETISRLRAQRRADRDALRNTDSPADGLPTYHEKPATTSRQQVGRALREFGTGVRRRTNIAALKRRTSKAIASND